MLGLLRATTTEQGLVVHATLSHKTYVTEVKVSNEQMATLNLEEHVVVPKWNYNIKPQ
jgi:Rhodopirellula transposase DDE domain